jgi:hypothetical protein
LESICYAYTRVDNASSQRCYFVLLKLLLAILLRLLCIITSAYQANMLSPCHAGLISMRRKRLAPAWTRRTRARLNRIPWYKRKNQHLNVNELKRPDEHDTPVRPRSCMSFDAYPCNLFVASSAEVRKGCRVEWNIGNSTRDPSTTHYGTAPNEAPKSGQDRLGLFGFMKFSSILKMVCETLSIPAPQLQRRR